MILKRMKKNIPRITNKDFIEREIFVTIEGVTWRLLGNYADITHKPPSAWWKIIQEEWDNRSYYELNDVVKYNNDYYRCIIAISNPGWDPASISSAWEKVIQNPNGTGWIKA